MTPTAPQQYGFSKCERLCGDKAIGILFAEGASFVKFPLRVVHRVADTPEGGRPLVRVLVSVPKKRFKRAVKRNRVKRLVREAYRLNKSELYAALGNKSADVAFVFVGTDLPSFAAVRAAMVAALKRIGTAAGGGQ